MPIQVTCPGCKSTFNVSSKYAGKQGPCPKCRAVINIPKPPEGNAGAPPPPAEVKIHAPGEAPKGAGEGKTSSGRHLSKPIERTDVRVTPLGGGIVAAVIIGMFALAWFVGDALLAPAELSQEQRDDPAQSSVYASTLYKALGMRFLGLAVLGFTIVWAGYQILRDDELDPFRGRSLWIRAGICTAVYLVLWLAYWFIPTDVALSGYAWIYLAPPLLIVGGAAAFYCFELDVTSAAMHYLFFFIVTLLLGATAGLTMPWSEAPRTLPSTRSEEIQIYDEYGRPLTPSDATPTGTGTKPEARAPARSNLRPHSPRFDLPGAAA